MVRGGAKPPSGAAPVPKVAGLAKPLHGNYIPQGLTAEQFDVLSSIVRSRVGDISDDIVVQGSRVTGTAKPTSDIDIAIRVSRHQFESIVRERFGSPNPGSAKERTMQHALATGKIQAGEAGLRGLRRELERQLGMEVDISIILRDGPFDNGSSIPLNIDS